MNQNSTWLTSLGNIFNVSLSEGASTLEWGKSFSNKYAPVLLTILFVWVLSKIFKIHI